MRRRSVLAALFLGMLTSCDDPTGTGLGRTESLIQDSPTGSPTITGSLAGNVFASLSSDGLTWIDLGSPNGITIPLQLSATATTVHGEVDAPVGTYTRVRLVFDGVTARLQSGSTIDGTTLTSDVNLPLGGTDQRVEVIVPVPSFTVEPEASVQRTVVFELRSYLWLTVTALQAGTVQDAALQGAVLASTRLDPR